MIDIKVNGARIVICGIFIIILFLQIGMSYDLLSQNSFGQGQIQTNPRMYDAEFTFALYENSTHAVRFQYPDDWSKVEILGGPLVDIKFVPEIMDNSSLSSFPPSIDVLIESNLKNNSSVYEYANLTADILANSLVNFNGLSSQSFTLSGLPAIEREFTFEQSNIQYQSIQSFTLYDSKVYMITLTAPMTEYLEYIPIYSTMTKSFQIIN